MAFARQLPRIQSCQDALAGSPGRIRCDDVEAHAERRLIGGPQMGKLAHEGLQVELGGRRVCQGAPAPVPRDRAVDQSPVFFAEAVIAEPELLHDACGVPFYEDVCPSREAAHNFLAGLLLQVHTYALFIAVEPDE